MKRVLELSGSALSDPKSAQAYLQELFVFPEYYGRNLDALYDCLTEIGDEIELCIGDKALRQICGNAYAYKVLMVIGKASEANPNITIKFIK